MGRRGLLADSALHVLAEQGPRGLTHRAVDSAAGVPAGTTSNYFRTREALVQAAVDRLEQHDRAATVDRSGVDAPQSLPEVVEQLVSGVLALAGDATLAKARFALLLDRPESGQAAHRRFVETITASLAGLGVSRPGQRAQAAADYCDGVLLHAVTVRAGQHADALVIAASLSALLHDEHDQTR